MLSTSLCVPVGSTRLASRHLQISLNKVQDWLKKRQIKANEVKSTQVTFTLSEETCPPIRLNNHQLPQPQMQNTLNTHGSVINLKKPHSRKAKATLIETE